MTLSAAAAWFDLGGAGRLGARRSGLELLRDMESSSSSKPEVMVVAGGRQAPNVGLNARPMLSIDELK